QSSMTCRDAGSAENAGVIFCPYIQYIAAPAHPCARGILYILYIKKPRSRPVVIGAVAWLGLFVP
ncbi:hypothetical protein, partial [Thiolapillus sp.]|uniref:hypothetical protein n=1 Tax=Thiolapillus sp. TaxID=2017437 RepID=UPI003AF94BBF